MDSLLLNGFEMDFSADDFTVYSQEMQAGASLEDMRVSVGPDWFLYREGNLILGVPRTNEPDADFGTARTLTCGQSQRLLCARIVDALPTVFPLARPVRRRPFAFLTPDDIVDSIAAEMPGLPDLISAFRIRPKFEFDAKIVESTDGATRVGLFVNVRTHWVITAPLPALAAAGVPLAGLYVVRVRPTPGQHRLIGRIGSLDEGRVVLTEGLDREKSVTVDEVRLEGSKSSFSRCLKVILGRRYEAFDSARYQRESEIHSGPAVEAMLEKVEAYLCKASPLRLTEDLECSISGRLRVTNTPSYQSVIATKPVEYCFDTAKTKRDSLAWMGLERYGPYSRDTFPHLRPRIAVFFPDSVQGPVEKYLRTLRDGIAVSYGRPAYPAGLAKTYGLTNPEFELERIPWLGNAQRKPAYAYRAATDSYLQRQENLPQAAMVVILDEHAQLPDADSPYLHAKAALLMAGVPVQEIRLSTLDRQPQGLQYINQNVSLQMYAKMGGTPWTVDQDLTIHDELVIGMGVCELSESRFLRRQRYVGITTVFRGDGSYLLANVSKECRYDEYPEMLRQSAINILSDIKSRNGWQKGDTVRIVFHAHKPLKEIETANIMADSVEALCGDQNVEFAFLTVSQDHPFAVLDPRQRGVPIRRGAPELKAHLVPERGTIVQLGRFTRLLCVNGPSLIKRPGAPLPQPLLINMHQRSTFRDLQYLTEQVLKFTALSWRSTLPASKPVTIYYSELIAELLARLRAVPDWSPFPVAVKLRSHRWFL